MLVQEQSTLLNLLREKYSAFPDKLTGPRKIGMELEYIVSTLDGSKPSLDLLYRLLEIIATQLDVEFVEWDRKGRPIKAKTSLGDFITFEFSYASLELILSPKLKLDDLQHRIENYLSLIQKALIKNDLCLLSLGYNPFSWINEIPILETSHYDILTTLLTKTVGRNQIYYYASIGASQIHLDVDKTEAPKFTNLVNLLSWIKVLLFANSSDFNKSFISQRDIIMQKGGLSKTLKNTGLHSTYFHSFDDLLREALNTEMVFYIKDEAHNFVFTPRNLENYLATTYIEASQINKLGENTATIFSPSVKGIPEARQYKSASLTKNGTIEIRSECQQPFGEEITVAAFNLGVLSNMEKIEEFLEKYNTFINIHTMHYLRNLAVYESYNMQELLSLNLQNFIFQILDLCHEGLVLRGLGEEKYLLPLYERTKQNSNPATANMKLWNSSTVEKFLASQIKMFR